MLGLEVRHEEGGGYAVVEVQGILHFGIWSRRSAAEATLGDPKAVDRVPLGFSVGFEVDDVSASSQKIKAKGWTVVQLPKRESWGQETSRFLSPSGALCEVSETPNSRRIISRMQVEKET